MLTVNYEMPSWLPAAVILAGTFVSLWMEKLCQPACNSVLGRPCQALSIHTGLFIVAWAIALAVCQRPLFALLAILAGQLLIVQVSNAKNRALREPLVFSDFGIFSQAIKHPRLYLPFLGVGRALLIGGGICLAVAVGWLLERPLESFAEWSALAAAAGATLLTIGLVRSPLPSLEPAIDISQRGLFASIAQYVLLEKKSEPCCCTTFGQVSKPEGELPDIVVVQSESFFDPRRTFPGIRDDLLAHFDQACKEANFHGQLSVPAWGANTMRPEFSFLTGISPASLGIHRFNPYRRVARQPIRALPAVLREAGYRTTCIHPHPARFFRRDRAFPNLGFERFMDIREFRNAKKCGPYIGDEAVTDKLLEELSQANGPVFLFAITMENHGPLHLEKVASEDAGQFFTKVPPPSCRDLHVYLRHLRNADRQLGRLRNALRARSRPYVLVFYGEHLPSMPAVYEALGVPDGRTDYFIESKTERDQQGIDLDIAELPVRVLDLV
jgi:hypothetical protein